MWLVLLLLDFRPFLSNWITLILSCLIITSDPKGFNGEFMLIDLSCESKKYFIHTTNVIASSTPSCSVSAELLVLIFYFDDKDNTLPCPNVRHSPVWLLQSGRTTNDASMFQVRVPLLSTPITSGKWTVSFK